MFLQHKYVMIREGTIVRKQLMGTMVEERE